MRRDQGAAAILAAVVGLLYLAPQHLAEALRWSPSAVVYVVSGLEACLLWLALGVGCLYLRLTTLAAVCLWPAYEAALRPVCRLMLPMDKPPKLPAGQNLCDVAIGEWTSYAGLWIATIVILWLHTRSIHDKRGSQT